MNSRECFRKKVREICDTLEFYDDLKKELIKTNINVSYVLGIDKQIRVVEQELADIAKNMIEIDTCECDGVSEGCSSPLCPSQYDLKLDV